MNHNTKNTARKRKFYFWAKKHLTAENIYALLLCIPLAMIIIRAFSNDSFNPLDFIDAEIVITFFAIAICNVVAHALLVLIEKKCEDYAKLTSDYKRLSSKYPLEKCLEYRGNAIPVVPLFTRRLSDSWNIDVADDHTHTYALPLQAALRAKSLMQAHSQSVIYNQICIRLEDVTIDPNARSLTLHTGRTTYYNSMVTNRACDYEADGEVTIRDLYEPGPYLQPLAQAAVSNHLGFNGFIRTEDGKIPFILRGNNLSIGKGTLANSIGASLKAKYCVDKSAGHVVTVGSLGNAILMEIIDELSLADPEKAESFIHNNVDKGFSVQSAVNGIFAVYRDLLECGKPQFLFFMDIKLHSQEIMTLFHKKEKNVSVQDSVRKDGKTMLFFTVEELKQAKITAGTIEIGGKTYTMLPSAAASVVMLLNAL